MKISNKEVQNIDHSTTSQKNSLRVITQPQITPHHMLQKPHRLGLHQLSHHIAQHRHHRKEPLIRMANIRQPRLIKQDLLHDENRDRLGKLGARFHDPETERDDFSGEEEVDDRGVVILFDEGADDAQRGEAEVFEGTGFGGCVEEGV